MTQSVSNRNCVPAKPPQKDFQFMRDIKSPDFSPTRRLYDSIDSNLLAMPILITRFHSVPTICRMVPGQPVYSTNLWYSSCDNSINITLTKTSGNLCNISSFKTLNKKITNFTLSYTRWILPILNTMISLTPQPRVLTNIDRLTIP